MKQLELVRLHQVASWKPLTCASRRLYLTKQLGIAPPHGGVEPLPLFVRPLAGFQEQLRGFDAPFYLRVWSHFYLFRRLAMNDNQVSADTIKFPGSEPKKRQRHHVTSRHYFILDNGTMRNVDRDLIENAWQGKLPWPQSDGDVRILSAVFDETENIVGCYFLLVSIVAGRVDSESVEKANDASLKQALETAHGTGRLLPGYVRQTSGWPSDWHAQVARVLGVKVDRLYDIGIGGPMLLSFTAHVSFTQAARTCAQSQRLSRM
jgi:hypothetical protein